METNIGNDSLYPKMFAPPPSAERDYFQHSDYLKRGKHFNNASIERLLFNANPMYSILRAYIVCNTRQYAKASLLNAIECDIDPLSFKGSLSHNVIRQHIKDFVSFGLLVRLSPRKHTYYVNPYMSHYLTTSQRNEWPQHEHLFPMINIRQMPGPEIG